jgi:hypothetical protein
MEPLGFQDLVMDIGEDVVDDSASVVSGGSALSILTDGGGQEIVDILDIQVVSSNPLPTTRPDDAPLHMGPDDDEDSSRPPHMGPYDDVEEDPLIIKSYDEPYRSTNIADIAIAYHGGGSSVTSMEGAAEESLEESVSGGDGRRRRRQL